MAEPEYDALVVGARVAGATVAARLAEQGRKVLLVDRDLFPSDTISTHALAFNAVDSLRRLGVLDHIEAAGFRRIFRHRAWVEDICIEAPAGPPGTYSIAPRRVVLDQSFSIAQWSAVQSCGCEHESTAYLWSLVPWLAVSCNPSAARSAKCGHESLSARTASNRRSLDPLRAVLLNQFDARRVVRHLPGLLDQMFEPMDRFRHAFIANIYEAEGETSA